MRMKLSSITVGYIYIYNSDNIPFKVTGNQTIGWCSIYTCKLITSLMEKQIQYY